MRLSRQKEKRAHIERLSSKLVHISQLERSLRLHRLGHFQELLGLRGERSDALGVSRSRKELGVGRERASIGEDVLGKEGGVGWGKGRDEEELLMSKPS